MPIDKREIERVKRRNELVAFIRSRGVSLTQRGKQLVGLCPFHDDHEPSFIVDSQKQLWNCLGACRESGDVCRFVMKPDGVDFVMVFRRLSAEGGRMRDESEPGRGSTLSLHPSSLSVSDQQWLGRAVGHYHAQVLQTPTAQDYWHLGRARVSPALGTAGVSPA